jgi:glycosyltransferase involved in cell wall biosynthesis
MPPTICLNMIVKNEERVLGRCLASVRPFVDHWVIVDTGSTDETRRVVHESLRGIPGELHERPWRDFGHNRSEALGLARPRADYVLVIDADEELVAEQGFRMPELAADQYMVRCQFEGSDTAWFRPTLARSALAWRYEGVLHEFLTADAAHTTGRIEGLSVRSHTDGARNVDARAKYERDARILEEALAREPQNARYAFYLAQSYRDAGDAQRAHDAYECRAKMGGWAEEVWYAKFQVALLREALRRPWAEALAAYLEAFQFRPARAEPLCALAHHYRVTSEWALAELFARAAAGVPLPDDILFVDTSVYTWRALDELAVATYWCGKFEESATLSRTLLGRGAVPPSERPRVEENLAFAQSELAKLGAPSRSTR